MMKYSERSDHISANVRPAVKKSLRAYIKKQREQDKSISISKWVDEAITEKLQRDGISVSEIQPEVYTGEDLPFEATK